MNHLVFAIVALSLPAVAQVQVARFDFQNQLSSGQPAFAYVSDISLSRPAAYSGAVADRALSLPTAWNQGGMFSFTIIPNYGQYLDLAHLQWTVAPNALGVSDCVSAVTVFANGIQVASFNPIPQNQLIDVGLGAFPSLQNNPLPMTFDFVFTGDPAGTSPHDITFLQVTGTACDLVVQSVTPPSLPTVTSSYFQILGAGFQTYQGVSRVQQVRFGSTILSPYDQSHFGPGSYEVFSQWKVRVRPPQCTPPGVYTIEITTDCDVRTVQVTLVDPQVPTVAAESTHPAGQTQCYAMHGGGPGTQILFLFASPSGQPSSVPGLLELNIGGGFSALGVVYAVGECTQFCLPVPIDKILDCHYFQGAVWHVENSALSQPLPTSETIQTCWY